MMRKKSDRIKERRKQNCTNFVIAIGILAIVISIVSIVVASISMGYALRDSRAQTYVASGAIVDSPFYHFLDASGAPLAMVLPNDLSAYVSKSYRIYSRTTQPHTVTIAAGPLTTTFDGVNTIATFGGNIGDGFVMTVIDKNRVVLETVINVAFT